MATIVPSCSSPTSRATPGGWLTLRLGRQLTWDLLDLRGLDGLQISAQTPFHVAIDAWGGLSQNGGLPIDPSLYVLDGTSRSPDRRPDDPRQQSLSPQPTVGFSARLTGLRDLQVRLSYRHTWSPTADRQAAGCPLGQSCAPAWGSLEPHCGKRPWSPAQRAPAGWGAIRYDLLSGRLDEAQASLRTVLAGDASAMARGQHSLNLDYRFMTCRPGMATRSGTSSPATLSPRRAALCRAADPEHPPMIRSRTRAASCPGRSGVWPDVRRSARTADAADAVASPNVRPSAGAMPRCSTDVAAAICGSMDFTAAATAARRLGRHRRPLGAVPRQRLARESRPYTYYADELRESSRSHGVALQAGVRWAFIRGALLHVFIEDSIDRYSSSQVRLLASLDLSMLLGPHGGPQSVAGLLPAGFGEAPRALPTPGY